MLLLTAIVAVLAQDCSLKCANNGVCKKGSASFSNTVDGGDSDIEFLIQKSVNGEYCDCPDGFTGVQCNYPVRTCASTGDLLTCFNGGKCLEAENVRTHQIQMICDCRGVVDPITGKSSVGKHCEHSATVQCDDANRGNDFCVNGVACNTGPDKNRLPCKCPAEFRGRHCEFTTEHHDKLPDCTLKCLNGAQCAKGFRLATNVEKQYNFSFDPNHQSGYQHCVCPENYFGTTCEHRAITCGVSASFCFHNSQCVSATPPPGSSSSNTQQQKVCDCSTAHNETHSFAGLGCQFKATEFCTKKVGVNGHQFCTNHGKCNETGDGIFKCECPKGWRGPHCEFHDYHNATHDVTLNRTITKGPGQHIADIPCNVQCRNGGECRTGLADRTFFKEFNDIKHLVHSNDPTLGNMLQHCVCPKGFTGPVCEHKIEVCGEDEFLAPGNHICLLGGSCQKKNNKYECKCEENVAGEYCQHKATSICDAQRRFCTNGGLCQASDGFAASCVCVGGYTGAHCEILRESSNSDTPPDSKTSRYILIASMALVAGLAIVFMIIIVDHTKRNQVKKSEQQTEGVSSPRGPPPAAFPASPPAAADTVTENSIAEEERSDAEII